MNLETNWFEMVYVWSIFKIVLDMRQNICRGKTRISSLLFLAKLQWAQI